MPFFRRQFEGHSAHVAFRVEVHYPWHAAYGREVDVHYREKRGGEEVFVCTLPNAGAAVVVPAWMFDRAFCSGLKLGVRRVSTAALRDALSMVDEIRSAKPTGSSGTVLSEDSDGKTKLGAGPIVKDAGADGDLVPDQGAPSRSEDTKRGRRSPRASSAGSCTRQRRRRGAR